MAIKINAATRALVLYLFPIVGGKIEECDESEAVVSLYATASIKRFWTGDEARTK